jgi:hypothetical protein
LRRRTFSAHREERAPTIGLRRHRAPTAAAAAALLSQRALAAV